MSILAAYPNRERMFMAPRRVPLPRDIIPFILENLEGFDVELEDGERIIITPRDDATVRPSSRNHLRATLLNRMPVTAAAPRTAPPRPKFIYRPSHESYTPEQARVFGMSKPRLRIYALIHAAGEAGIGYAELREKSNLPHGSVQQILNWLRKQQLITGTPEA